MKSDDTQISGAANVGGMRSAPARYEVDRRDFFKTLGCGVMVLFLVPAALAQQEAGSAGRAARTRRRPPPPKSARGCTSARTARVTVYTGKTEVGQNIRTSLTQAVAEELRVPVSSIKMVMADTDLVPYDAGTFGSQTTPQHGFAACIASAAAARGVLLDMAAEYFKVDRAALTVADGKIFKTSANRNEAVTFGQLDQGPEVHQDRWTTPRRSRRRANGKSPAPPSPKWTAAISSPAGTSTRPT